MLGGAGSNIYFGTKLDISKNQNTAVFIFIIK